MELSNPKRGRVFVFDRLDEMSLVTAAWLKWNFDVRVVEYASVSIRMFTRPEVMAGTDVIWLGFEPSERSASLVRDASKRFKDLGSPPLDVNGSAEPTLQQLAFMSNRVKSSARPSRFDRLITDVMRVVGQIPDVSMRYSPDTLLPIQVAVSSYVNPYPGNDDLLFQTCDRWTQAFEDVQEFSRWTPAGSTLAGTVRALTLIERAYLYLFSGEEFDVDPRAIEESAPDVGLLAKKVFNARQMLASLAPVSPTGVYSLQDTDVNWYMAKRLLNHARKDWRVVREVAGELLMLASRNEPVKSRYS